MGEHVEQLLMNDDIDSKFSLVKIFNQTFVKGVSQQELDSILIDYLLNSDSDHRITNFDRIRYYGPGKGLSRYVANQLFLSLQVESLENKMHVLKELDVVLRNLYNSKNPLLKMTQAKRLVDLISDFLTGHFYKIIDSRFLSIYFVPFENKHNNAVFDINTNSIALFRTKEKKEQTPEYVFFHEFGHILHAKIFKSINQVPPSFMEFNNQLNPRFFEFSQEDQLEIYADMFSIAAMLGTEYENYNPFIKKWDRTFTKTIKEYFVNDISNL